MNKNDMNSRVLMAVLISFVFIVIYSYFIPDTHKQQPAQTQNPQSQSAQNPATQANPQAQDSASATPQISPASQFATSQTSSTPSLPQSRHIISKVISDDLEVEIDELGRISQVYLKDKKFTAPKQEGIFTHLGRLFGLNKQSAKPLEKLPLLSPNAVFPLEMRFQDFALNQEATTTPYSASTSQIAIDKDFKDSKTLILTQKLKSLTITKTLTFYFDNTDHLKYDVKITLTQPTTYFLSSGQRPIADDDGYAFHGVVLKENGLDGTIEKIEDKDAKNTAQHFTQVPFIAASDRYFTTLLFTRDVRGINVQVLAEVGTQNPIPYISLDSDMELEGYIGPKDYRDLQKVYAPLTDVVEYGLITFFAKPVFVLLDWLYSIFGNWGWAIIGLTIIVRIILFPLSYKGIMSMQKLKDLTPKMKEIQEQYKGNPQKLQMHMMQLYKKHGANPLGGCLPLLLQIPVFFAIYRVLYNAVELKSSEWIFWIHDLSVMDPYLVLPILMGLSMYIQQALTPSTLDPMQARIFKLLPIIFTIFFITFPAGLVLYWTINNIFAILMQIMINKIIDKRRAEQIAQHHKK
ncbi:inner membrane protein translocase component YidC [Helicobacter fennelliae]|uniref:Membrane protein insertase YidC n=1 Tax=Helicobacter fennelliae TaxID=215 RepID=A0A2X3AY14_9HELI|nr:membrane protein insertase YidC [Helicobacter fennelliae]SQB97728.1 inner membrane protein translocase component YidC [Helicobacter fennelliae]